ncbi:MAG: hypothetical protein ACR2H0_06325, partial [Candidatus Limnocylindrales bacterium]
MARDDIPWDQPVDYADQTDSATPDQPAWDRPSIDDWFDSELPDDRPPGDDWSTEATEQSQGTPAADRPLAAWPQTVEHAEAVAAQPVVAETEHEAALVDPDDAYAPALGDVWELVGRAWPETNGHDDNRNDSAVVADPLVGEKFAAPPAHLPEPAPIAWPVATPEPTQMAETAPEPQREAAGQISWLISAVEPTTLAPGVGPTPPPELFDDRPVGGGSSDASESTPPEWESSADADEWDIPAAIQEAYAFQPDWELVPVAETAWMPIAESDPEPERQPESTNAADEPDPAGQPADVPVATQSMAPYSTAPASADEAAEVPPITHRPSLYSTAPTSAAPFVVRVEVSIVDESKTSASILGAADFPVAPLDDAERVDADAGTDTEEPAPQPTWLEPTVPSELIEQADWLEQLRQPQTEPAPWAEPLAESHTQPAPWPEPTSPVQQFVSATVLPPWATAPAPIAPLAPEFAPPPITVPATTQVPEPVEEPGPRWAQPMYDAELVTQLPLTADPSPFAPAPVVGEYAQPLYAEPPYAEPPAESPLASSEPSRSTGASAALVD